MKRETGIVGSDEITGISKQETHIMKQENLRKICGTIAMFEVEKKPKNKFAFIAGNVVVKPQVELTKTPWLAETKYLVNSKILFEVFVYSNGKWQSKRVITIQRMLEFLATDNLWNKFVQRAIEFMLQRADSPQTDKFQ